MGSNSWLEKYKPKKIRNIVCNRTAVKRVRNWLDNYNKYRIITRKNKGTSRKRGRGKKRDNKVEINRSCMLITGNHGVGKTVVIDLILKEYGYVIQRLDFNKLKKGMNISTIMNSHNIIDIIKNNKTQKIAIVVDEIESITSTTKKSCIIELQKSNDIHWYCPIIYISNNKHNKMLSDLKKHSYEVRFYTPYRDDMKKILYEIVRNEKINIKDFYVYDLILDHCQSDIRRLINTLFDIHNMYSNKCITEEVIKRYINTSQKKDIDIDLFTATSKMLYEYINIDNCLSYYESHKVLLPLMIHQNYIANILINQAKKNHNKKITRISECLSNGDVTENYIYSTQNWSMQGIHGFYTCAETSFHICDNMRKIPKKLNLKFSTDLNKTSIKKINKKNIINTNKCFTNMNIMDYIYINKIVKKLIKNGEIERCINIMKNYNIKIDHFKSLLKIDKIMMTKNCLSAKNNKEIQKYIDINNSAHT